MKSNKAGYYGGYICLAIYNDEPNLNNEIEDIGSTFDGGYSEIGGAVNCQRCNKLNFTNTIFQNNIARTGGAIAVYPGDFSNFSYQVHTFIYLTNCQFHQNYALYSSSALYISDS